jgi:hypothetical protein
VISIVTAAAVRTGAASVRWIGVISCEIEVVAFSPPRGEKVPEGRMRGAIVAWPMFARQSRSSRCILSASVLRQAEVPSINILDA